MTAKQNDFFSRLVPEAAFPLLDIAAGFCYNKGNETMGEGGYIMSVKFKTNFAYLRYYLLFALVCVGFFSAFVYVYFALAEESLWVVVLFGVALLLPAGYFAASWVTGLQRVTFRGEFFISKGLFGKVEELDVARIQWISVLPLPIFRGNGFTVDRPCIMISSLERPSLETCYAKKGEGYIVLPATEGNLARMKELCASIGRPDLWQR